MKQKPFSQRGRAELVFHERLPGEEAFEPVAWQMPDAVLRIFQAEARRRGTDLNSLVRDFVCEALSDRAAAIKHINAERKRTNDL